jgi:hypothetical protein
MTNELGKIRKEVGAPYFMIKFQQLPAAADEK